jgi:hypothetical protein
MSSNNYGIDNKRGQMTGNFSINNNLGSGSQQVKTHQTYSQQGIDLNALANELAALRQGAHAEPPGDEKDKAIGALACAEEAARKGDEKSAFAFLRGVGQWGLDLAKKLGSILATEAITKVLGNL